MNKNIHEGSEKSVTAQQSHKWEMSWSALVPMWTVDEECVLSSISSISMSMSLPSYTTNIYEYLSISSSPSLSLSIVKYPLSTINYELLYHIHYHYNTCLGYHTQNQMINAFLSWAKSRVSLWVVTSTFWGTLGTPSEYQMINLFRKGLYIWIIGGQLYSIFFKSPLTMNCTGWSLDSARCSLVARLRWT